MQPEEQGLIDGLFDRLKQAANQNSTRDAAAEQRIVQHLSQQPEAPYYMAQTILIQEAAIKQLNGKIQEFEAKIRDLEQKTRQQQNSGSFLAGLFGGSSSSSKGSDTIPGGQNYGTSPTPGYATNTQGGYNAPAGYGAPQAAPASIPRAGGGFLSGALQTAAGVAGGVAIGGMLSSMFHHSQPEEIVNIINEPDQSVENDPANQADDRQFLGQSQDSTNDYTGFDNDDFDGFGDDGYNDDSFI